MYRLTLYSLFILIGIALIISLFGVLPFTFLQLLASAVFLQFACWLVNIILAKIFRIPVNVESVYITAAILTLILTPPTEPSGYVALAWIAAIAMASKFILAIGRKHLFNPAAIAVLISTYVLGVSASWWIGNRWMFVFALVAGFLIVRKIRRWDMVYAFLATTLFVSYAVAINHGTDLIVLTKALFLNSALVFFATVMFTEPMTAPPTVRLQVVFGILVGLLFTPFTHFGNFYFTPELALVVGNIFAYVVSPKYKLQLTLAQKIPLTEDIADFVFKLEKPISFQPGQYMEWTLAHEKRDMRGNRRYFTIASSPTEGNIRIGVKFYDPSSSYKKALAAMKPGDTIVAAQLMGDFTLSPDIGEKSVFIAGGIGITPFRSILKHLVETHQKRDIVMFYSNRSVADIIYKDVFNAAERELGIRTIYTVTEDNTGWAGETGRINAAMIKKHLPDYQQRRYYISGTHQMVTSMEDLLRSMGIPRKQIKTDFFPGFV